VLTNTPDKVVNIHIDSLTTINTKSDHYLITITYTTALHHKNVNPSDLHKIALFSRADPTQIAEYILRHGTSIQQTHNVNEMWNNLRQLLLSVNDNLIPSLPCTRKNSPKWFTPQIKHQLNKLHTLRRPCTRKNSPKWFTPQIKHQLNKLHTLRRSAKKHPILTRLLHWTSKLSWKPQKINMN
jgi:hypothetical protein